MDQGLNSCLDFSATDVFTATNDDVFGPVHNINKAIVVDATKVSSSEVAIFGEPLMGSYLPSSSDAKVPVLEPSTNSTAGGSRLRKDATSFAGLRDVSMSFEQKEMGMGACIVASGKVWGVFGSSAVA